MLQQIISLVSLQQQIHISPGYRTREHAAIRLSVPNNAPPTDQYYRENGMEPNHVCHRVEHLRTDTGLSYWTSSGSIYKMTIHEI